MPVKTEIDMLEDPLRLPLDGQALQELIHDDDIDTVQEIVGAFHDNDDINDFQWMYENAEEATPLPIKKENAPEVPADIRTSGNTIRVFDIDLLPADLVMPLAMPNIKQEPENNAAADYTELTCNEKATEITEKISKQTDKEKKQDKQSNVEISCSTKGLDNIGKPNQIEIPGTSYQQPEQVDPITGTLQFIRSVSLFNFLCSKFNRFFIYSL